MAIGNPLDTIQNFLKGVGPDGDRVEAPQTDGQVLAECEDLYKKARDDRRQYERDWQLNLAFLRGQQWLEWNKQTNSLWLPPAPPWRVRHVVNLIQPVYRTIFGKITQQQSHRTKVVPAPGQDSSRAKDDARAQDELLEHLWEKCGSEKVSNEVLRWTLITGTGIHHPCWDKTEGPALVYPDGHPQAGQPVREASPDGTADGSGAVVHVGEVDHLEVSPFEFFPEPLAGDTEDMDWCFYVKVRPASYVQRKYGLKMEEQSIPVDEYAVGQVFAQGDDTQLATPTKGIIVKEFWRRPTEQRPEGQYVAYADQRVLYQGPNPYPSEPIPFFPVRDRIVPGRFWGRSLMSDLVPVQQNLNKLLSQAIEIRNATARPKWAVARGSLRPGETITTAPAEIIVYDPVPGAADNGRPFKIAGGDVPASFFAEAEKIHSQFFEIAGLHDFSRGLQGLGGIRAGFALQMILEQDDSRIGIIRRDFDTTILRVEKAKLRLVKQFYTEPRTITVLGPDRTAEAREFHSDIISDDPKVELITSGSLPTSWSARQQFISDARKQGLLPDPREARKLLGLANIEGIDDEIEKDERQAQRENELMMKGQVPQAHDFDNHLVHGQQHDSARKDEEYEQVVAQSPQIAQAFVQHVEMHKQFIQAAQAAQFAPPRVTLSGKLTPQQEIAAAGAAGDAGQLSSAPSPRAPTAPTHRFPPPSQQQAM